MASGANLGYYIQDLGALQQQQADRQQMAQEQQAAQQKLLAFQQQQIQQKATQAAQGNYFAQLMQPPVQQQAPAAQPPMPGQASQPVQMPGGMPMPGGGMPGGQVNRPPMPTGGVQGQMPPPFRPMPSAPPMQQPQGQGSIPAPPVPSQDQQQGGPWSMQAVIQGGLDQGLTGEPLAAFVHSMMPVMDMQSRAQATQKLQEFKQQMQVQTLQERAREADQRSRDAQASIEERRAAHADSMSIRNALLPLQMQALQQKVQGNPEAKLESGDLKFMAQQYLAAPDPSIFTNLGRGVQGAQNVVGLRKAIKTEAQAAGLSPSDVAALGIGVQGEKAAARTAGTKAANVGLAATEASETFPLVRQTSAALPRGQFVPANAALQAAETKTGDPRVIALGVALNTAGNAYARAVSPSGVPTVSDKEHVRELWSAANTPEQLDAALNIMEKEMAAARRAPEKVKEQQRQRISGKPSKASGGPEVGVVESGYRFKGGDPSSPSSWERVQ